MRREKEKREDELKQKAAEQAKREEEWAWKKARMEEERVKKAEMKAKKAVSKAEESRKKKRYQASVIKQCTVAVSIHIISTDRSTSKNT